MLKVKISTCVVFILFFTTCLKAQENSPYTRFGVGNLFEGYPVDLAGYGGLSAASEGPTLLNYANPASYGSLDFTTLSVGAYANDIKLSTTNPSASQSFQNGSLTNLCIGFPVILGHWGASFGVSPFSREEYSIANLNNTNLGYTSYDSFDDSGTLYRFYIGNGFKIKFDSSNHFNFGFNVSYLFGTLWQSDDQAFPDTFNAYSTQHNVTKTIGGVIVQGGVQYLHAFKNHSRLVIGFQGNLQTSVPGRITNVWDRFVFQDVGNGGIKDTILGQYNQRGNMIIPATFGFGVVYDDPEHFTVGINYDRSYWSNFSSFNEAPVDTLVNSWRIGIGGQLGHNLHKSINTNSTNYATLIKYSAGFYYEQTYLEFRNTIIPQYALTLGVELPLTHIRKIQPYSAQKFSTLNIALEIGEQGTTKNNLVLEQFVSLSVGFTLNDHWFVKRKFD